MSFITRQCALLALTAAADLTGKEGYAVELDGNGEVAVINSAADKPYGVLVEGAAAGKTVTVALNRAFCKTLRVKLDGTPGTVANGTELEITATGTFKADTGSGSRVVCAQALEAGAANGLVDAVIFRPEALS